MIIEHLPLYIFSAEHLVETGTDVVELQGFCVGESPTTCFSVGLLSWVAGSVEVPEGMKNVELEGKEPM